VNAFQFGPDGALYGPRFGLDGAGAVVRIDVESGQLTVVAEGLDFPTAVRFTDDGDLLVAQINPPQILQVDQATGGLSPVMEVSHPIDNFAVAADGTLYVTGYDKPVISVRGPDGSVRTMDIGRP
jgi:sugar lactone lactonase YvrE